MILQEMTHIYYLQEWQWLKYVESILNKLPNLDKMSKDVILQRWPKSILYKNDIGT